MTDAKSQRVDGYAFLRVNDYLLDRLKASISPMDPSARRGVNETLARCHALAIDTADAEISRLPDSALADIWSGCFGREAPPADLRDAIRRRYVQHLEGEYETFVSGISGEESSEELRKQVARVCERVQPSITEHHGQGLFLELARESLPERQTIGLTQTATLVLYEPGPVAQDPVKSAFDDGAMRDLLVRFAPRIAQEHSDQAERSDSCDRIGTVQLAGRPDHIDVHVHTDVPSVYAYVRHVVVHGRDHVQLVYCYWFPEHPPMRPGDPEAGPIDGATLRMTLDSRSRPVIIEAVQNCGCHYRCFAARALDDAARREFGAPETPADSALTSPKGGLVKVFADDLYDLPTGEIRGPMVFSPAGSHVPVGVSFSDTDVRAERIETRTPYELHAYDLLENMPTNFGRGSMFGADGLVHHAGRPEGWLLAGTGMLSAGQPRQRGTQLICWDQRSFDDPHLLEETLRLPKDF